MAKTKALISRAVTAQLICVFVFAYANCWFSHAKAQLYAVEPVLAYKCSFIMRAYLTVQLHVQVRPNRGLQQEKNKYDQYNTYVLSNVVEM